MMIRLTWLLAIVAAGITSGSSLEQPTIDDYFNDFTSGWVRSSPNQAIATRYFTGAEQERLEQQLSPETVEYCRTRIQLAKHGLEGLRHFDRAATAPSPRRPADLVESPLETLAQGEPQQCTRKATRASRTDSERSGISGLAECNRCPRTRPAARERRRRPMAFQRWSEGLCLFPETVYHHGPQSRSDS